ncbi:MAG: class I SAM-dependent methyltransferase [Phycisphaerales bacterium]
MSTIDVGPWLRSLPQEGGFACISSARAFAHDEAAYDRQYANDPANFAVGRGLLRLLDRRGAPTDKPAVEIGCGTGLVSLGLAEKSPYPLTLLTDPSPAFLRITQRKVSSQGIDQARVAYGVLMGEEIDRLPAGGFSLVVLRSTLHHVLDVDGFIRDAGRALAPGGILTFQEPCMEGYVLMGAVAQFLTPLAAAAGRPLSAVQSAKVDEFARTMAFYSRRDVDKTQAEDKHLFRVDELMCSARRSGMELEFLANVEYNQWAEDESRTPTPVGFTLFFRNYAKYCMSWDETLMARFDELLTPYCRIVEESSGGGSGPYLHGVFVARKA